MNKQLVLLIFMAALFCATLFSYPKVKISVKATNGFPVHNLDTGLFYTTIQSAIDASQTRNGHTIKVDAGFYNEYVEVDKELSIEGESPSTTIVNNTIMISVSYVSIRNMEVNYVYINIGDHCTISNVNVTSSNRQYFGIYIRNPGSYNLIQDSTVGNCQNAIAFEGTNNTVMGNDISNSYVGIFIMTFGSQATIIGNSLHNNNIAIQEYSGSGANSTIAGNAIHDSGVAFVYGGQNQRIYHNDFFQNAEQVKLDTYSYRTVTSFWDNGFEGNYWDSYGGADIDNNGIGDTPYVINALNQDNFPLMQKYTPEFPSAIILSLLLLLLTFALTIKSKKTSSPHGLK